MAGNPNRVAYFEVLVAGIRHPSTDVPLSGGTVEFYAAGTSTAKQAWTDVDKTTLVSYDSGNDIYYTTLDSAGRSKVFGNGVYKLVVKDSEGATLLTIDYYKVLYTNQRVVLATGSAGDAPQATEFAVDPDYDLVLVDSSANAVTLNWFDATAANQEYGIPSILVKKISADTNTITIDPYGSQTINGSATFTFTRAAFTIDVSAYGGNLQSTSSDSLTVGGYAADQTPTAATIVISQDGTTFIHDDWIDWATKAGAGLAFSASDPVSGALSVNVDDSTIEINTDTLRVKDGGITTGKLADSNVTTDKLADSNVTTGKIADDNVTMAKIENYTASSSGYKVNEHNLFSQTLAGYHRTTQSTSYIKVLEYQCPVGGTLWSRFGLYVDAGTGYGRIYVNGSASGTEQSTSSVTEVSKTDTSITVAAGDLIQLYLKINSGANSVYVRNWTLRSSTAGGILMALNTGAL